MSDKYIWVTCANKDDWWTALHRHVLKQNTYTTLCGSTWMPAQGKSGSPWRRNRNKFACPACVEKAKEMELTID